MKHWRAILPVGCVMLALGGCVPGERLTGMPQPTRAGTPRDAYAMRAAAPDDAAAAALAAWEEASRRALRSRLYIAPSFQERVSFPESVPHAVAYRFRLHRGQRIDVAMKPTGGGEHLFGDVFEVIAEDMFRHVHAAGRDRETFSFTARAEGEYVVRIQPPLHAGGTYDVTVTAENARVFPVAGADVSSVRSVFGDPRDGGVRDHEGVDIFAMRGTPAVAVADAWVTAVRTTPVGGRVLWLSDAATDLSYYYAHLEEQLVHEGQRVSAGDTIGRVGNTGNASGTSPHLHFGVYRPGSIALDPVPLLASAFRTVAAEPVSHAAGQRARITGERVRLRASPSLAGAVLAELAAETELLIIGDVGDWHRVLLPDGTTGFVAAAFTGATASALRE